MECFFKKDAAIFGDATTPGQGVVVKMRLGRSLSHEMSGSFFEVCQQRQLSDPLGASPFAQLGKPGPLFTVPRCLFLPQKPLLGRRLRRRNGRGTTYTIREARVVSDNG